MDRKEGAPGFVEHLYLKKMQIIHVFQRYAARKNKYAFGKGVLTQSKEPVMHCKPEASQREGIANRLLSLRAIWKLTIVELVFWVTAIGIAVFRTLFWA